MPSLRLQASIQVPECGCGNQNHVINERPEEVLFDCTQRLARRDTARATPRRSPLINVTGAAAMATSVPCDRKATSAERARCVVDTITNHGYISAFRNHPWSEVLDFCRFPSAALRQTVSILTCFAIASRSSYYPP